MRPGDWAKLKVSMQVNLPIITSASEYETQLHLDTAISEVHTELLSRLWIQVVVFLFSLVQKLKMTVIAKLFPVLVLILKDHKTILSFYPTVF